MAFDAHKNFAYSTVATAPSPATSGTSLVVAAADGAKFPAVPFNATIWPASAQPTTTNAEVVRVTAISTDTLTITRAQESSSARTVIVGDQIAATITKKTIFDIEGGLNGLFDYVISGCVWTADAAGSTKAASMTAGTIWLNDVQLTVAAVTSRTFTASKDVYVDFSDNGDGTAVPNYNDNTTNAASPALTAGRLRNAIVVVGASSIATAASINQGQVGALLPIASSQPYEYTDSLGNIICPRDPNRKILGRRQIISGAPSGVGWTTSNTDITGLGVPVIVPANRSVRITFSADSWQTGTTTTSLYSAHKIMESTTVLVSVSSAALSSANTPIAIGSIAVLVSPSSGLHTYKASYANSTTGPAYTLTVASTSPATLVVELI